MNLTQRISKLEAGKPKTDAMVCHWQIDKAVRTISLTNSKGDMQIFKRLREETWNDFIKRVAMEAIDEGGFYWLEGRQ